MTARIWIRMAISVAVVTALAVAPADAESVMLDDFEAGVGAWRTNDREVAGRQPSDIATIYTVSRRTDDRVQQAALVEFLAAQDTWASVSLPIDGALWVRRNMGQISLWMRGDGSDNTVDLTLRSTLGEERRDVSYVYPLPLQSRDWQRRSIRLFGFTDADGNPPTEEGIRNAYLLQFAKTGSWPTLSLYVDDIEVEPIPGAEGAVLPPAAGPLAVRVDFTRTEARMLGQFGANLGENVAPVLDTPAASAAIARGLEQLTPCVARLRLSDFYDTRIHDYDLIRLNRTINWVGETGARALVCLDPAWLPGEGEGDEPRIDPNFESVAVRLAAMRRGGPTLRYYELFDRPLLSGHYDSVEELVEGYNSLAARVLAADPEARVGGPGLAAAWESQVRGFLAGADTLHFLSLHFLGAQHAGADRDALLEAAVTGRPSDLPDQLTLGQVRHLAQSSRRPMPELFVTMMSMTAAASAAELPQDRQGGALDATWTAATVLQSSAHVDKFLHARLYAPQQALLDERGRALPGFTVAWLLRQYAPRGSTLCQLVRPMRDVVVAAVWTGTARNVIVVYAGEEPRSVVIDALGVGSPLMVRERRLISSGELGMFDRPNSASQSIEFEGPGVSVIQFVGAE